jgi:hypothetical protein
MTTISLTASLTRGRTLFPGVLACAVLSTAATFLSQHYGAPARAPTGSGGSPISSRLSSP